MDQERRKEPLGRRAADRGTVLKIFTALLVLVALLQTINIVLHFQDRRIFEEKQVAEPLLDEVTTLTKPAVSPDDPSVRSIVESLSSSFSNEQVSSAFPVVLKQLRVISATNESNVRVAAQFESLFHQSIAGVSCALDLLDERGGLLYREYGEQVGSGTMEFIVDNPPQFHDTRLSIEEIRFVREGF